MLNDFIVLDMAEDAYTQINLGRHLLATSGCKVNVKKGRLTFYVGESHAAFNLFEDRNVPPSHLLVTK